MKFILFCLFSFLTFFDINVFSQILLIEENFDYSTGDLTVVSTNWSESPSGSVDIEVQSGNLSYSNYPSSGTGNLLVLNGGASGRSGVVRTFTPQSNNGKKVYASFILKVTSTDDMNISTSDGDRFFNLKVSGSSSFRCCIFVKKGTNSSKYQIGLGKLNTSTPNWYSTELDVNSEYLIVTSYVFQSGDDDAKLWINPNLSGSEPPEDLIQSTGSDASNLGEVQFRQQPLSGDMEVDGLRIADSWSQAPLPVELSSFTASVVNNSVMLSWRTETEVDNYGFEIERASLSASPRQAWEKIGFVNGSGNSNAPVSYTFTDKNVQSRKYNYRLKQIDTDGDFEYSDVIEVDIGMPNEFQLAQNFPNPFNPVTKISWQSPVGSRQILKIYDVLGNEVATLVDEYKPAGRYEVEFDGTGLSSGMYFYQLKTENFTTVKKMILTK